MKKINSVIIAFFILVIWVGFSYSNTIFQLSQALNEKLFSGSLNETISVLEEEKVLAKKVKEHFEALSKKICPENQIKIKDLMIILDTLPYQYARFESEIKREVQVTGVDTDLKIPENVSQLKDLVIKIYKLEKSIELYRKNIKDLEHAIAVIKDDLNERFGKYKFYVQRDVKEKGLEQLVYILRLRIDYALYSTKLQKNKKLLDKLEKIKTSAYNVLKNSIKTFKVNDIELQNIKKDILNKENELKKSIDIVVKEWNGIYKDILDKELQIETYSKKISNTSSENAKLLFKIEQQRLLSKLNELFVKQRGLELEKIKLNIELKEIKYWLDLAEAMKNLGVPKIISSYIVKWEKELDDLDRMRSELNNKIEQINDLHTEIIEKMALVSSDMENSEKKMKKALKNYYYQLKAAEKEIGNHIIRAGEVKNSLEQLIFSITTIYNLFKKETVNVYQRVGIWSKKTILDIFSKVKYVLFYPLFKMGKQDVNLVTFIKILILLLLGIVLLRRFRKRINKILLEKTEMSLGTVNSITTLGYYFSLILVVLISLSTAGMDLSQLSIILGALGVGIGFGLQTIANNFVSGLILLTDRSIKVGDLVQLENGIVGEVMDVSIRATVIKTFDGEEVIVPNSEFVSAKVHTWTFSDDWRRLKIPFGVSYNADPNLVEKLAIEAAREVPATKEDDAHPVRVFFEGFGESSLDFSLRVWCRMHDLQVKTGLISDYYFVLFRKLKGAGIEIPYPQRDLHLRSISKKVLKLLNEKKDNGE